ncbi:MAG: ABC transporter ATP-binding protein [Bacteroidales bacterium]|nr:ABC transporter ATP-binding protein [Bacteroidales bacterium]
MDNIEIPIQLINLDIGYNSNKPVLSNINQLVPKGELIAVIGKNGIGKSTLLRTITKLQHPLNGDIIVSDKNINSYSQKELAHKISFVSTEIIKVANLKVIDLVSFGRYPYTNWLGKIENKDKKRIYEALDMVGMLNFENRNINEISDGERQRVMIARTLAQDTDIIILDEPTAFIDLPNRYEIISLLNYLTKHKSKTIIFSTHDINIAIKETDKLWLMYDNKLISGAPEDLILSEELYNIFDNTKLFFDKISGEIKIEKKYNKFINLAGEGDAFYLTKMALERLGYKVENSISNGKFIKVEKINNKYTWKIENKNIKKVFYSIYDLSLYLSKI